MNSTILTNISLAPPKAARRPHVMELHGDRRTDDYYWLKERENQEVLDYLAAENEYTGRMLQPVEALQEKLFLELKGRIKEKDSSVPCLSNGYYYYSRFDEGHEYPLYCRKKGLDDPEEEVMLDVNQLSEGLTYFNVGGRAVSENNRILAYGEDTIGRRIYTIRFKDLETGQYLSDEIPNTSGSTAWASDNKTLFYTVRDEKTLRSYKVMRHRLGAACEKDEVVFEETDETFHSGVYRSRTDKYLVIYSASTLTSEFRFLEAADADGDFRILQPRIRGMEYHPEHAGDRFYIRTNAGGAANFKLMSCPVDRPEAANWEEVIPHREDVLLEDVLCFRDFFAVQERTRGISGIRIVSWKEPGEGYGIEFGEEGHGLWFGPNEEFNTGKLRFLYSSMTTPVSTFDIDMATGERFLLREQPVLGGYSKEDYVSERIWVTARDGAEVPVSLVYAKTFKKDGTGPLLLYAYGSYGQSTDPYFSSNRLSLMDRGFAFAIAHVRGGEELGRQWYENGKLLNKMNTFHDFIDCAEYLLKNRYTSMDRLFAMGGSAGGLLIGAVMNLRPDLWKGVVASVPFVDVLTTMLDDTIPLTTFEYDEWGDPHQKEFYDYIRSYSPYDNVESKEYPDLLVVTGLHDSQVQYWEPAKWVAKLRVCKKGDRLLLMKTNMEAGHGGASGRFKKFREIALEYAFLLYLSGIDR